MEIKVAQSHGQRMFLFRIPMGLDLVSSILKVCKNNEIQTAVISSCIGSLKVANFQWSVPSNETLRGSVRTPLFTLEGPIELLSAQGLVGYDHVYEKALYHIHVTLCDRDDKVYGGHVSEGGNIVHSTMDVVLIEAEGVKLQLFDDPKVGLSLITPTN